VPMEGSRSGLIAAGWGAVDLRFSGPPGVQHGVGAGQLQEGVIKSAQRMLAAGVPRFSSSSTACISKVVLPTCRAPDTRPVERVGR